MRNTFLYKALFFLTLMAWPAFAEAKDDPKAIQATASSLLDQEKYDESYPFLVDLERLYSKNGTNYEKAYLEFLYGKYCYGKTLVTESIYRLNNASELVSPLTDSLSLALKVKIEVAYSACYLDCDLLSEAQEHLQKAIEINKKIGDERIDMTVMHNMAILYTYLGQYEEAIRINKDNLKRHQMKKDLAFTTYYNMAFGYMKLNETDSAWACMEEAPKYISNEKEEMMCIQRKGDICLLNKDYSKAEGYFKKALDIIGDKKDSYSSYYAQMMVNLAKICYNTNRYSEAIQYLDVTDSVQDNYSRIDACDIRINIMKETGRYKEALALMYEKEALQDSIQSRKNIDQTNQQLMQYKIKTIESEYASQREIARLKQAKEKTVMIAIVGLLIGIIIVVILLLNRKKILLRNKQLGEKALAAELETRNRELASNVITMMKKNEIYAELVKKLANVRENAVKTETKDTISGIIKDIEKTIDNDSKEEFVTRFKQVHSEFYDKLLESYPNLTANEIRLCAYLKLNMSTKDICALTGQSERSIVIARYRLRRKMGFESGDASNLATFIANI